MGLFTFFFGDGGGETGKTPEQLDAELLALQRKRAADNPEKFNTRDYNEAFNEHLELQQAQDADVEGQLADEFEAGLDDGAENISKVVRAPFTLVGKALKGVLFGIPIWVYLIAGVVAFFYFGGGPILKAFIKKKAGK